ncbi:MAG TPA: hypothetical protein PKD73_05975 [Burkholderiaceae bacterium]|nr:hypothetical protein [Burkholderiaceae bacterium]
MSDKLVFTLSEQVQRLMGERAVLGAALVALLRTHPDPRALGDEFRRAWLTLGSPNQADEPDDVGLQSMRRMLEILQDACPEIRVLPPGLG